ncbi:hypothetical protein JMJ77_0003079 [Colletotrichum scovillei]|uniref:Uncharacterized protein n=1 Tax=Colletotrichum scovillei TaxID=1209932 RepID=A0A9P7QUF2_9PEZI|nr:hypothetical protein JMJ78_0006288 [Colletotrichum scovillei]KAG7043373.1 hypothetical protein JMJ77_0003079 [Colletotrichum scovillei]KAG7062821.1 hypothetical protein JMJ76_0009664 [Colletotrichum scovillei]
MGEYAKYATTLVTNQSMVIISEGRMMERRQSIVPLASALPCCAHSLNPAYGVLIWQSERRKQNLGGILQI